jgi:hypothetical protein
MAAGFLVFDNRIRFVNQDGTLTPEALWRMQSVVSGLLGNLDPTLIALAGVTTAANKLVYATGVDAFSTTDFSPFARTLLDDADAATMRGTLGAEAAGAGAAVVAAHVALPDPHAQYALDTDLSAHTGDTANPHATTAAQVGADPAGTATAAIVAHVGLADPHTQYATDAALTAHTGDVANPHAVTKTQVGLGNVDNTSDANKPVSTATQAQLQSYWRRFLLMGA